MNTRKYADRRDAKRVTRTPTYQKAQEWNEEQRAALRAKLTERKALIEKLRADLKIARDFVKPMIGMPMGTAAPFVTPEVRKALSIEGA